MAVLSAVMRAERRAVEKEATVMGVSSWAPVRRCPR
jgi:hypothetical protein